MKSPEIAQISGSISCFSSTSRIIYIRSIYFDAKVHEYEMGKNSLVFVSKNNCICIYCACKITKLAILISQGSTATHLRCGGQCSEYFVENLLPNSTVKKFENRLIFARVMDRSAEILFF